MIPDILTIGPITIHSFGLMMVCLFLAAKKRLELSCARAQIDTLICEPMIFWAAIGGLLGARIWYLLSFPEDFFADPLGAIFSSAGFIFYGGFVGGALALYLFLRNKPYSFLFLADRSASALAVGYGVGRIGCHLSGDGDYGSVTNSIFGFQYSLGVVPTPPGIFVHPTPIYESFVSFLIAEFLIRLENKNFKRGSIFGSYLILSGLSRFAVEFFRIEPKVFMTLTQAQLFAIGMIFIGLYLCLSRTPDPAGTSLK